MPSKPPRAVPVPGASPPPPTSTAALKLGMQTPSTTKQGQPRFTGAQIGAGLPGAGLLAFKSPSTLPGSPAPAVPEWQSMYSDLIAAHDKDSATERSEITRNSGLAMNAASRRADVVNARMGRSIAGGFAGLQGQAMIGGMESQRKALAEQSLRSGDKRRDLLLKQLDQATSERRRGEDKDFERELHEDTQAHQMDMLGSQLDGVPGANQGETAFYKTDKGVQSAVAGLSPQDKEQFDKLMADMNAGAPGSETLLAQFLRSKGWQGTTYEKQQSNDRQATTDAWLAKYGGRFGV